MIGHQAHQQGRCLLFVAIIPIILFNLSGLLAEGEETNAEVGHNVSLTCNFMTENVWWMKNGHNITSKNKRFQVTKIVNNRDSELEQINNEFYQFTHFLNITNVHIKDTGNYTCMKYQMDRIDEESTFLQAIITPRILKHSSIQIKTKISTSVQLYCLVEAHPMDEYKKSIRWHKADEVVFMSKMNFHLANRTQITKINETVVNVTLDITDVFKKDNGTYVCSITSPYTGDVIKFESSLLVLDVPQVSIDYIKAVGANKIFLNWTMNDGNDPIKQYFVQHAKDDTNSFTYYNHPIDGRNTSYVLDYFDAMTNYQIKISAQNNIGMGPAYTYPQKIRTLEHDPIFIPQVAFKGNSYNTITIGWSPPPSELLEYVHYYELVVAETGENSSVIEEAMYPQNSRNLPYMFDNLRTATDYKCKVRSCSELTKLCGNWSEEVIGNTMDGVSSEPVNLKIACQYYNISGRTAVSALWEPPVHKNGKITTYHVTLEGVSTFRSEKGLMKNETYGPKAKNVDEKLPKTDYQNVPLNMNYTLRVAGVTRSKKSGEFAVATCTMPASVPDVIGRFLWGKLETETHNWIFKLYLPRISERKGPICGYRIYLVRIGQHGHHLGAPEDLEIMTYHEAHAPNNTKGGAYIAEILSNENFQPEVFLGDGQRMKLKSNETSTETNASCRKLLNGYYIKPIRVRSTTAAIAEGTTEISAPIHTQKERLEKAANLTSEASKILNAKSRRKRQHNNNEIPTEPETKTTTPASISINSNTFEVFDGLLDPASNYTGFVEVIVNIDGHDKVLSTYSEYFETMTGGPVIDENSNDNLATILSIVTQILCGLILFVLVLLTAMCILHRYAKNAAQGDEVISLRDSLSRALCGGRSNHRHLIGTTSTKPADIGPISKVDLPQAYVTRHKDTDYGFLREYEMLPNRFNDRTTKNSDAKENVYKNRYPDIKAYDQTRVRLAERNGAIGSDYINANFVLGYKERKKFICAQGPMDSTVNDFWRMIWEQHLEIIVMLTNLEEYNKAKCAKYWPEKIDDSTKFGDISVTFLEEQRYSDFLVRDLKVTRRNSNGSDEEEERRHISQYHYLVWKDFMAPEHPHGIIKFIRQINSVYSVQRGPILVHCSAGVGRTGTLVALDSLMQQLDEENQVSIFNTVCDMRHQRNFLVQSLKQYIFLYRALLDIAQFGNTEIPAIGLNVAVENLKARSSDSKEQCKLEIEFEKIKSITDESNKTCAVGSGEENRCKNRSDLVIPFDRNRVILTPIPAREHSTYINASFIEGYDNSESFIITQDPLEDTIPDFWRMISEQGINTVVMISEIGDGTKKCPRYWADDEIQYDHILVKYMHSESCPYYTKREFNVTNCKMKDTMKVTQFQYNGWPTVEGEVPEVARGMIELVDQAQNHHNNEENFSSPGPVVVHCNLGTERSSIYVAMCILVQHLRTEKKIDICTTTRKLRSQRNLLLDSYPQYEFLHRAMVNYADLHRLSVDSNSDS